MDVLFSLDGCHLVEDIHVFPVDSLDQSLQDHILSQLRARIIEGPFKHPLLALEVDSQLSLHSPTIVWKLSLQADELEGVWTMLVQKAEFCLEAGDSAQVVFFVLFNLPICQVFRFYLFIEDFGGDSFQQINRFLDQDVLLELYCFHNAPDFGIAQVDIPQDFEDGDCLGEFLLLVNKYASQSLLAALEIKMYLCHSLKLIFLGNILVNFPLPFHMLAQELNLIARGFQLGQIVQNFLHVKLSRII